MQGFGVVCEAVIMALAVVARSRWLQDELATSMRAQQELVENQNKVLEETVAARTRELAEQHQELDEAHRFIVSSVDYASRLQRSQLPKPHRIKGRFASLGIIWAPRDTIGGDLWWLSSSQHAGPFTLAVADCTGHGVPGAMLSLLVSNSLERIFSTEPDKSPAEALMTLDFLVRSGLNQDAEDSESDDGCDAAILKIDRRLQRIEYAGAKIDLFHVQDQVVHRYGAKRISLGYKDGLDAAHLPQTQLITYKSGDVFAIVTDGLTDQVGGAQSSGKPVSFGYRRLERILLENDDKEADTIAQQIKQGFENWQASNQRRDDVTAIVFKL
jgi:serine phosphatase RsbU (regulator of sigma subunit)